MAICRGEAAKRSTYPELVDSPLARLATVACDVGSGHASAALRARANPGSPTSHHAIHNSNTFGRCFPSLASERTPGLHSDAELQDGANKMLWSNGDVWVRLLDTASLQELRDLLRHTAWTEKPQPGQHIYAFSDTHVSGDNLSPTPFTFTRDRRVPDRGRSRSCVCLSVRADGGRPLTHRRRDRLGAGL